MKLRIRTILVLCAAVLADLPLPRARASEFDKKTNVSFSGPVEIPGRVLPAGAYVFKRLDPNAPYVVEILSADERHVEAMVLGIPASRLNVTGKAVIDLGEPRAAGAPPAVRDWFYPGDSDGVAFVYRKKHAPGLAQANQTQAPETPPDLANDAAKPEPVSQPVETPAAPAPVVAETEKAPPSTVDADGNEGEVGQVVIKEGAIQILPKTASNLPLLALAGSILTLSAIPLGLVARVGS